ncbi:hypothetical protein TNCV_7741 [Trichonephila clavipes]|nr:hypothetical protein TNCV_7741 [Trichonephila clavipes]
MTRRKTNLSRKIRKAKSVRRVIAHQTEEERASVNERSRQKMTQICANETSEEHATRLENARLGDSKQRGQTYMVDQSYNKDQKSHMNSGSQLRTRSATGRPKNT